MQRDIEFAAANGEKIRKQLGRPHLDIANIYISEFPPVDEYEFRLRNPYLFPEGSKTSVSSFLLTKGEWETGLKGLAERLQKDIHFDIQNDYSENEVEELKRVTLGTAVNKVKREKAVLTYSKPFFTYVFMVIQLAVFIWMELNGGSTNTSTLIKYGAKVNQLIYEGEYWRFITPVFLHIGFLHLAMNTLALYFLGTAVEQIFGRIRFFLIYLFAGVAGVIASLLFSTHLSAGASGAIFGCFGALLYFGMMNPKLFFRTMGLNVIVVLAINLVFGFSASGIDNAGHLGGLAGGFLAAGVVNLPKKPKLPLQLIFLIMSAGIVWGSLNYGFSAAGQKQDEDSQILLAQEYIKQNNYDKAYSVLKSFEDRSKSETEKTYFLLSYVEIKKQMLTDAKLHLQKAIRLDPNFHQAYFNLALINLEENDLNAAKLNAEKAVKLNPNQKEYTNLVDEINQQIKTSGSE
ncbi:MULTISPECIES: rhomboid family protein [Neobacillus]|nr:rhomboid family intramembrane serine protease [Neobacillus citreus]MCH6266623.1 rhomboid family intramembrane serine protease [Neobacillus citreus]